MLCWMEPRLRGNQGHSKLLLLQPPYNRGCYEHGPLNKFSEQVLQTSYELHALHLRYDTATPFGKDSLHMSQKPFRFSCTHSKSCLGLPARRQFWQLVSCSMVADLATYGLLLGRPPPWTCSICAHYK